MEIFGLFKINNSNVGTVRYSNSISDTFPNLMIDNMNITLLFIFIFFCKNHTFIFVKKKKPFKRVYTFYTFVRMIEILGMYACTDETSHRERYIPC